MLRMRSKAVGSSFLELIFVTSFGLTSFLYLINLCFVLFAFVELRQAGLAACRAAANGRPSDLEHTHECIRLCQFAKPYQRAVAVLRRKKLLQDLCKVSLEIKETVASPLPDQLSGGQVSGEIQLSIRAWIKPLIPLPAVPVQIETSFSHVQPITFAGPTASGF